LFHVYDFVIRIAYSYEILNCDSLMVDEFTDVVHG